MKLTKSQLKQIIKEELEKVLEIVYDVGGYWTKREYKAVADYMFEKFCNQQEEGIEALTALQQLEGHLGLGTQLPMSHKEREYILSLRGTVRFRMEPKKEKDPLGKIHKKSEHIIEILTPYLEEMNMPNWKAKLENITVEDLLGISKAVNQGWHMKIDCPGTSTHPHDAAATTAAMKAQQVRKAREMFLKKK